LESRKKSQMSLRTVAIMKRLGKVFGKWKRGIYSS
jgi:hypothetical protein